MYARVFDLNYGKVQKINNRKMFIFMKLINFFTQF